MSDKEANIFKKPVNSVTALALRIIILFCFAISSTQVFAQKYLVHQYIEPDGLASSIVYSIAQDSTGRMWFATDKGTSVYDGNKWKNYTTKNGLEQNSCSELFYDKKGKLWALARDLPATISLFKNGKWITKFELKTESNVKYYYSDLLIYYDSLNKIHIWIGTRAKGLFYYHDNQWKNFKNISGLSGNVVTAISLYRDSLLIATDEGLFYYDDDNAAIRFQKIKELGNEYISGLADEFINDKTECLWITGENWVGCYKNGTFEKLQTDKNITLSSEYFYLKLQPDKHDGLYYGNSYNLGYYSGINKQTEKIGQANGLITNGCYSLLLDRENNIWIASYRGVNKIPSKMIASYTTLHGLAENEVTSIVKNDSGIFFLGHNGQISVFNGETFETIRLTIVQNSSKLLDRILDMEIDKNGNLWVAASRLGLAMISPDYKIKWIFKPTDENNNVNSVIIDTTGSIWFCTRSALYKFENNTIEKIKLPGTEQIFTRKLFLNNDGSILLATSNNGLLEYNGKRWKIYKSSTPALSDNVYSFIDSFNGKTLVGLYEGLGIIKNDKIQIPDDSLLQIKRPVFLLFKDSQNRLWMGTNNGLYCKEGKEVKHYTVNEGLAGQEINRDACVEDKYNNIWFGTNNGLSRFQGRFKHKVKEMLPPKTELNYAISGMDTLRLDTPHSLKYNDNTLEFHYIVLSFIDENEVLCKIKLNGYDTTWTVLAGSNNNRVRYDNLPPGEYTFCFKARNAVQKWSKTLCSSTITINNPYYFTWWFLLISLVVLGALIYFLVTFITQKRIAYSMARQINERTMQLRNSERALKRSNKTKDRFFSIIAHDLRSPFNSIVGFSEMLNKEGDDMTRAERENIAGHIYSSAKRAFDLLENLLAWARAQEGKIPYNPEVFDINMLIEENISLFSNQANLKKINLINLNQDIILVFADMDQVRTVLRNLISNAIKFTPLGGQVVIISRIKTGKIQVCVKDTGIGIPDNIKEKLFRPEEKTEREGTAKEKGTGLGLVLCKEFIEMNKGDIWVKSEGEKGSTFCFNLPLGNNQNQETKNKMK